jgi:hypothetical protein
MADKRSKVFLNDVAAELKVFSIILDPLSLSDHNNKKEP